MTLTYNGYERDGKTPTYGGYSTRIAVDENYVLSIPEGIPLERAAPLLCAGITTYSPLRHFGLEAGDKLGVVGLGGLGHMAVKFGHAMGAQVTVLSHSPRKRDDALGARRRRLPRSPRTRRCSRTMPRRFDFILDTVSAQHDYNAYLGLLRRDGIMVLVGTARADATLGRPADHEASEPRRFADRRYSRDPGDAGLLRPTRRCRRRRSDPDQEINEAYRAHAQE